MFIGAGADAGEQDGFVRQAEQFGEGLGDEGGLVVAALTFTLAMERDGDDDVGLEGGAFAVREVGKDAGEKEAERLDVFEFQQQDGADYFAAVERPASGAVEGKGAIFFIAATDAESRVEQ